MTRYQPTGYLMVAPQAVGAEYQALPKPKLRKKNGIAVVTIRGPLEQHATDGAPWESYEAVTARVEEAIAANPRGLLLSINSPGGVVAGAFEAAAHIRRVCDESRTPLHAYVDGQATSAAYAIACVCDSITVPETASVGSVGVLAALVDQTAMDQAMGLRFSLVASGARKTDGQPHGPTSDDALIATQGHVDTLAQSFFEHVANHRPISAPEVQALQAGVFYGRAAVSLGLADLIGDMTTAIDRASNPTVETSAETKTIETESLTVTAEDAPKDVASLLRSIAEGDNEEEAKLARKALAAMAPEDEPDDSEEETAEAPDDSEEEMKAVALSASIESRLLRAEKRAILASRPDLPEKIKTAVMSTGVTADAAEQIIAATPRASKTPVVDVAPAATRGDSQGAAAPVATAQQTAIATAFGLGQTNKGGTVRDGNTVKFGHGTVK